MKIDHERASEIPPIGKDGAEHSSGVRAASYEEKAYWAAPEPNYESIKQERIWDQPLRFAASLAAIFSRSCATISSWLCEPARARGEKAGAAAAAAKLVQWWW
mmetsp:Transcript_37869/g.65296  ORF Transcript_37869/g.65296 Transcript_37869/m.65296 type:complete len:103 (+) Transcript_37869:542-850(+)